MTLSMSNLQIQQMTNHRSLHFIHFKLLMFTDNFWFYLNDIFECFTVEIVDYCRIVMDIMLLPWHFNDASERLSVNSAVDDGHYGDDVGTQNLFPFENNGYDVASSGMHESCSCFMRFARCIHPTSDDSCRLNSNTHWHDSDQQSATL